MGPIEEAWGNAAGLGAASSAPSSIVAATISKSSFQATSNSLVQASPCNRSHRGNQYRADDWVVLGLGTVGHVPGAEIAELRHDRIEVAKRLAQEHQARRSIVFCRCISTGNSGFTAGAAGNKRE
jgi:hypothetical protein